jgi:pimeloyl-ACP methyl ester carboxylesterase
MAAIIPKATLRIIENGGHLPMLEWPDATATTLRRFLSAVGE